MSPRLTLDRVLLGLMEIIVLAMVIVSPWFFGAIEARAEFALMVGLALLLGLAGLRILVLGEFTWHSCPVAICLACAFVFTIIQIAPLSHDTLAFLSPATSRLYDELIPAEPEILVKDNVWRAAETKPGSTLSICPTATKREALHILAIFSLFCVVRNHLADSDRLRRLAYVGLANGAMLSMFALLQFFWSKSRMEVYGYKTGGAVFGPFVCRNHFPFYANLCLGLGLGLWLMMVYSTQRDRRSGYWRDLLNQPLMLWLVLGLGLMLVGDLFSLSRGGIVAVLGSAAFCFVLKLCRWPRTADMTGSLWGAGLTIALAITLVYAFGQDAVATRFSTIWEGKVLEEGRGPIWDRAWAITTEYPLWGTGAGTFMYAEPTFRTNANDMNLYFVNAHNEYLDALAEGGMIRLLISLSSIGSLFWLGYRALGRWQHSSNLGLVWGLLFGIGTLVIHSFVDFGIHLPAIAVFAAVLAAYLASLGDPENSVPSRLTGIGAVTGALVTLTLAALLFYTGRQTERIMALRLEADSLKDKQNQIQIDRRIALLTEALQFDPDHAEVLLELARAHRDRALYLSSDVEQMYRVRNVAHMILGHITPSGELVNPGDASYAASWANKLRHEQYTKAYSAAFGSDMIPALTYFLRSRDASPLQEEANLELARHAPTLVSADKPAIYLERAERAAPANPIVWYIAGELEANSALEPPEKDHALKCWHRSLELTDRYLDPILDQGVKDYTPDELLEKAIPDDASQLWQAANRLFPDSDQDRVPTFQRALAILDKKGTRLDGPSYVLKSQLQQKLGNLPDAIKSIRQALHREPEQTLWRYQLAVLLYENKQGQEARRELNQILALNPHHDAAKALMPLVQRMIAEKE